MAWIVEFDYVEYRGGGGVADGKIDMAGFDAVAGG